MLIKEECVNAFNKLFNKAISANFYNGTTFLDACENQLEVFKKLIKEHFDNPPLKFEELKKGMWVWDDKAKWIYKIKKINGRNSIEVDNGDLTYTSLVFEENRYYRKEVK